MIADNIPNPLSNGIAHEPNRANESLHQVALNKIYMYVCIPRKIGRDVGKGVRGKKAR
jgi:hypothetical protein